MVAAATTPLLLAPQEPRTAAKAKRNRKNSGSYAHLYVLILANRPLRLYLISLVIMQFGEWFTYVASIRMIDSMTTTMATESSGSATAVSLLVLLRLAPSVLLSVALGGTMADSYDRRLCLVALNMAGGMVTLAFIGAYYLASIRLLYVLAFVREGVAALATPCSNAMLPQLVAMGGGGGGSSRKEQVSSSSSFSSELKQATMLTGLVWAVMSSVGAACGGFFVSRAGIAMCFVVDSMTFLASAAILMAIPGTFHPVDDDDTKKTLQQQKQQHYISMGGRIWGMALDAATYIRTCSFGGIILLRATSSIVLGGSNVLNVSLSKQTSSSDRHPDDASSERLGLLHAVVGIGSMLGPVAHDIILLSMGLQQKTTPAVLQMACIVSFFSIAMAYVGLGLFAKDHFAFLAVFSVIRAMGGTIVWIDSSVLVQVRL
jgi:hypothetical protein